MDEMEKAARAKLPNHVSAYFAAGAGTNSELMEGAAAWSAIRFRPRVLRDVSAIDLTTTVLGTSVSSPVLIAPMAQQRAAHDEGEVAMGRAVASRGSLLGVSTATSVPFADISGTGAPWWFQVYVTRERHLTELLVERAVASGAGALILTADMMALLPPAVNPRSWPEGVAKTRMFNLTPEELAAAGPGATEVDLKLTFDDIGWLSELSGLPVLVKGVLRADDAANCVAAGAAGVVVSTHGGRRTGPSVGSAHALPEVAAALSGRAEIYVDSGIRSGQHVAAAIAMGARGVFVGRPALWALAARGEAGVAEVLDTLTAQLSLVMLQLGVSSVSDLATCDLIARARS